MPIRSVLSSRQSWSNHSCRSCFVGAPRKKKEGCSFGSVAAVSSSSSSLVTSHRINTYRPTTARLRRGEVPQTQYRLSIGLVLPRSLSTATCEAPRNNKNDDAPLSQQPPPAPVATDGKRFGSKRKWTALYPDLVARSEHLADVAMGKAVVTDTKKPVRIDTYDSVLEAWVELARDHAYRGPEASSSTPRGIEAARHARALLQALETNLDPQTATSTGLRPKASFYDLVLHAYAVCGGGHVAAMEAQELLDHMLENVRAFGKTLPPQSTQKYPEPSIRSYNIVLNCWAKAKSIDSGIRAEGVLALMDEWRRECHVAFLHDPSFPYRGCYPTSTTVSSLILALAECHGLQIYERVMQLLQEVVEVQRNPSISEHRFRDVRLEESLFNSVIASWVSSNRDREAASKAEEILSFALKLHDEGLMKELPCKRTYTMVVNAWARCENSTGDCAQRAHDILVNMIRLYRQGEPIELDIVTFDTCVVAWSRCANVNDSPEKAEEILQELLSLYGETGLVNLKPDVRLWKSMQTVWLNATKRTESMDRCAEIIQRMQKHGCQPSSASYGKVLQAAGRRGLGERALTLLEQYALESNVPLLLDVRCFDGVLEALAREPRVDALDRATAFIEKMKSHDDYANPDGHSYTVLLEALSRFEDGRQAERGRDLLEGMMQSFQEGDESCRPDDFVVSAVLKLCASTKGTDDNRHQALVIALGIFRNCESHYGVTPNQFVYGAMLIAINRLVVSEDRRSERLQLLKTVSEMCRVRGHMSNLVLTVLRKGTREKPARLSPATASPSSPHLRPPTKFRRNNNNNNNIARHSRRRAIGPSSPNDS